MSDTEAIPDLPPMSTYRVTLTQVVEMDVSVEQEQAILDQTGESNIRDGIEALRIERMRDGTRPEEKLLAATATVEPLDPPGANDEG